MRAAPKAAPRSKNRRRHVRARIPATAILFTDRRPLGPCLVEDMSPGGMRIVTGSALRRGRVVSVLLDLPERNPFLVFAQVARHELRRTGEHVLALSFLDLPADQALRLKQVVARTLAESHPSLEFFDTGDEGRRKRLVLADDGESPLVG